MRALSLLFVASTAASHVSSDRVLILGKSAAPLWHQTCSSPAFSDAGLANLALNSMGLPTGGHVSSHSAVLSPLQADIFTQSEVHALVLLDGLSTGSVEAVDAALDDEDVFHELYPVQDSQVTVPVTVAQVFKAKYPQAVYCAGSHAICSSVGALTTPGDAKIVQQVLEANSFLSSHDDADISFATQLAQVLLLAADMEQHQDGKTLYIVGLSSLQGHKQELADQLVTATVTKFLDHLMKKKQVVAAQVMTGTLPVAMQQVTALSRRARNRKLTSRSAKKPKASEKDESAMDDDEEDEEDLDAASGSLLEEDANSTSSSNSSAPEAVSMPDIAEYQIILWTSVSLVAILLLSVSAMANMDAGRDSLLYAKFIADVNGRKTL
uniref:RxLR effector candidate protein n=1 Tax=Hyaloperonospora arabidopsidis (strain Emoy2) TaxID=559515 RepID=M4BJZ5_HYAAE